MSGAKRIKLRWYPMDESEFTALAESALERIERALEESGIDADTELKEGGVLEIEFSDGSRMVINRHGAAREIWVAARSGGFHFRWGGSVWRENAVDAMSSCNGSCCLAGRAAAPSRSSITFVRAWVSGWGWMG